MPPATTPTLCRPCQRHDRAGAMPTVRGDKGALPRSHSDCSGRNCYTVDEDAIAAIVRLTGRRPSELGGAWCVRRYRVRAFLELDVPVRPVGDVIEKGKGWPTNLPAVFGPAAATFVVTAWVCGRGGVDDLGKRLVRWRMPARWWIASLAPLWFLSSPDRRGKAGARPCRRYTVRAQPGSFVWSSASSPVLYRRMVSPSGSYTSTTGMGSLGAVLTRRSPGQDRLAARDGRRSSGSIRRA